VSRFGDRIYAVALPFQLFALGASPLELGIAAAVLDGTYVILLLVGGAVADRVPRRRLILLTDLAAGLAVATVALLSWTGRLEIAHLYIASAIFGGAEAFFSPAYTALTPELVPNEILQSSSALRSLSRSAARIAGPLLGGVLVASGGPALGFGMDALTFLVSLLATFFVRSPRREPPPPSPVLQDVREGFAFTLAFPWIIAGALAYALGNVAYSGQTSVIVPLFVRDVLRGDATTLGAITAAFGVGALGAAIVLAQVRVGRAGIGIFVSELVAAVAVAAIGVVALLPATLALILVMGAALTSSDILWQSALQRHVRGDMLGRVTSIVALGTTLANPIGPLIVAIVVQRIGPAAAFTAAGIYGAIVAFLLLFALRRVR
jgi:MFS family permease